MCIIRPNIQENMFNCPLKKKGIAGPVEPRWCYSLHIIIKTFMAWWCRPSCGEMNPIYRFFFFFNGFSFI